MGWHGHFILGPSDIHAIDVVRVTTLKIKKRYVATTALLAVLCLGSSAQAEDAADADQVPTPEVKTLDNEHLYAMVAPAPSALPILVLGGLLIARRRRG